MFRVIGRFIRHNWFLKLFSIVLASLLWLTKASEGNYIIDRSVPINFRGIPNNMETTGETATEVQLRLQGSRNVLDNLSPSDVIAVISLAGEAPGRKVVIWNETNVQAPGGVQILRYDPPQVQFNLERTMERTLPVRVPVEGVPADGFNLGETKVTPATVQVEGPESVVRPLESVSSVNVNIDQARGDVVRMVELNVVNPLIRLPSLSPHEVVVEIREVLAENSFRIQKDPLLDESEWIVEPAEIMMQISGPRSLVNSFDAEGLYFSIDTEELDPGTAHQVQPEVLNLSADFLIMGYDPPLLEVRHRDQ